MACRNPDLRQVQVIEMKGGNGRSMKKLTAAIMICFMISCLCSGAIYAREIPSLNQGLDVVFVVDSSGSMKSNDPNGVALDMVKAFIDTVHIEHIRIGFVSYNDKIVSSLSPVSIVNENERAELKGLIDTISYSGNTDIGLGLSYAQGIMNPQEGRNRIMVLISDGETDLGKGKSGRTLEQSNQDMEQTVQSSKEQGVPIYTIAFGKYDGNKAVLERIAGNTSGKAYTANSPEALIEVFYGIFGDHLSYKIQEVTNSVYAKGNQEIRYLLDEKYLDELDLLLISPQNIGETSIRYGDNQVETTSLSHYVVGKIREIDPDINEITVSLATAEAQVLKAYLISYRSLTPVLELESEAVRNTEIPYRVYFKDKNGVPVEDESFYKKFQWNVEGRSAGDDVDLSVQKGPDIQNGMIQGSLCFKKSGTYQIMGNLGDNLGDYHFKGGLTVTNTPPSGSLPQERATILTPEYTFKLNEYFQDTNGDPLQYSMEQQEGEYATVVLNGAELVMKPEKAGVHSLTLFISDGEDTLAYPYQIRVLPLWQVYWWVIAIILLVASILLYKMFHKPKPELVQIVEKKAQNHFSGKLDAYFTTQPDDTEEIPPLTFPMFKIKPNKVSLGELMNGYSEVAEILGLDSIHLIADENRHMILYHTSDALVMIGNSIICRRLQYSVGFGDIIYITSPNGAYELEVHYVAMIQ